ncbi:transcriptional regulator, partial [Vibrio sp. 10N.261.48.A2]
MNWRGIMISCNDYDYIEIVCMH